MELWTQKYQPKTLDEMVMNQNKIKSIRQWFDNFDDVKSKKILLLSGPPGIGKTTIANLALKEYGYSVIEYNASSIRGPKNIREVFDKVLGYKSVIDMFKNNTMPTGIIMDEIDTLCNGGDKGGMTEFLNIIKSRKKKNVYDINNPIICTYNDFSDKKLTELKNQSFEVKISKPSKMDLEYIIEKIEKGENMKIDMEAKILLIKHSMSDIRRLINILYDVNMMYHMEESITQEIVEKVMETFMKKDVDVQIFDMTRNILNKPLEANELIDYYDSDRLLLPMMLHENYINTINNRNISQEDKRKLILKCADGLIENDIYQTAIYENQSWEMADTMALSYCLRMNEISKLKKFITNNDSIEYTVLLNKISLYHTNKKLINTLNNKANIDLSVDDMYFLSEMIVFHVFNKKGNMSKLEEIIKEYNLTMEKIDLLIRINKMYNTDVGKKYSLKVKKELAKLF